MSSTTNMQSAEKELLVAIKQLPQQRIRQVIDFARWLQTQPLEGEEKDASDLEAEDAAWEQSYLDNRAMFRALAHEALEEEKAGQTLDMIIEDDHIRSQ